MRYYRTLFGLLGRRLISPYRMPNFGNATRSLSSKFEQIADETLASLYDYFEDVIEECDFIADNATDTSLNDGVLVVTFGAATGTYVLNKQLPNKQLWLSSPISGPKRYDYDARIDGWTYKHDNRTLHRVLQDEVSKIVRRDVNFFRCKHSGGRNRNEL